MGTRIESTPEPSAAERRSKLEAWLRNRMTQLRSEGIPRRSHPADPAPLSFAQERVWFIEQLSPGTSVYNIPLAARLTGPLDVSALRRALSELVRRHEVLRTVYRGSAAGPVQIVRPEHHVPLPVDDLTGLEAGEREKEAMRRADLEASLPFDLAEGPVLRGRVLRLAEDDHIVVLTVHHIAADGWSTAIMARELGVLYEAFRTGRPSPLSDPALQYADYAVWQRREFDSGKLERELEFWKDYLSGELPRLSLPADRPRPPLASYRGDLATGEIPKATSDRLAHLAREEGATLFMVLLAGLVALLHRYSGQTDILVGTPVANRTRPELEELIGFFVNTVVVRADCSGEPTFRDLIRRVRARCLDALSHEEMPFERLVAALDLERDLSRNPIFQVMFSLVTTPPSDLVLPGLEARPLMLRTASAKFDLGVWASESPSGIALMVEYATDLFERPTVDRILGHYRVLLEAAARTPDSPLGSLPLLTQSERECLRAWIRTRVSRPDAPTVLHELFERQVPRRSESTAVVFGKRAVSYRELDDWASSLAEHLCRLGARPDSLVGVALDRSPEMVVALLGVLKAGAAYVPLDPDYPAERIAFMTRDSGVRAIVTREAFAGRLPAEGVTLVPIETFVGGRPPGPATPAGESPRQSRPAVAPVFPDNLAYCIYTSGSTGRPKGVLNAHGGIVDRLLWLQRVYPLSEADRVLFRSPYSFDISITEVFWPLSVGATLVVAPPGRQSDAAALVEVIRQERVNVMQVVPSMLALFLREPGIEALSSLRLVFSVGEALPAESVRLFYRRLSSPDGPRLVNLYGPTEAAVEATFWECPREGVGDLVPIGRPVDNVCVRILDENLEPVPVGVPGELCLGGLGVARGYVNRPDLTAERFIPDPDPEPGCSEPGARLYRTGDLARFLPSGEIEFLGRLDHQVKLRGYRIELEEIEAHLRRHPGVKEAVVTAREDVPGDLRLVAYLVPSPGAELNAATVRESLKSSLPEYMVPASFVVLDALPLSPNGKVDRKALPVPDRGRPDGARTFEPPESPLEETLAQVWAEVLRVDRIGRTDDFFAMGGHSLLAARVVARVQETLGVEVPLIRLFESPTLAAFAAVVGTLLTDRDTGRGAGPGPALARAERGPTGISLEDLSEEEIDTLLSRLEPGPDGAGEGGEA